MTMCMRMYMRFDKTLTFYAVTLRYGDGMVIELERDLIFEALNYNIVGRFPIRGTVGPCGRI